MDDTEVARSHKRELQRSGDGGCREGECIDVGLHLAYLFLGGYTEFLFLVNNQQTEVVPLHCLACQAMCADKDVYLAVGKVLEQGFCLLWSTCP